MPADGQLTGQAEAARAAEGDRPALPSRLAFLGLLCLAVFLAGLELMVTAVALPSIIGDTSISDWTQLRRASWIINGYLLAYVTAMPLAGRASDRLGTRRLLLIALVVFTVGSALAGRAQGLNELVAARIVQGFGAGALVPLATAAASHLFGDSARPRALGVVTALTFLGMAAGPFVGATILQVARLDAFVSSAAVPADTARYLVPSWRWIFYVNVPLGLLGLFYAWALGVDTPRHPGRIDVAGAALFAVALAAGIGALTWAGSPDLSGVPGALPLLVAASIVALALTVIRGARVADPFFEVRFFRDPVYAAAIALSLLTGYALATAIVGGAVFVDRVLYRGPEIQQIALGALAGATAVGAIVSGLLTRTVSERGAALGGLAVAALGLWRMSGWDIDVDIGRLSLDLGLFGLGFGATVTPRSTAAVEAVGAAAFGAASAAVTVARMVGMAIGLAVLTQLGSGRIEALASVVNDPALRDAVLSPDLRGLPLNNALVVEALERWAAGEAARIMSELFLVALAVTLAGVVPALVLRGRASSSVRNRPRCGAAGSHASDRPACRTGSGPGP